MEVVFVASGGGHLEQLRFLSNQLELPAERRWITFDTPQARSMLQDEKVDYVPYVAPRDVRGIVRNLTSSKLVGSRSNTHSVISTGAGLALAYLPRSAAQSIPTYYIESATRVAGPSVTGRILAKIPSIQVRTQHQGWANDRWNYIGSVFDCFEPSLTPLNPGTERPLKVFVSLGTIKGYGFRRLVEKLIAITGNPIELQWQTGSTNVSDLDINSESEIPHSEMIAAIDESDVLVAHAGAGIALTALRLGKHPILVPRDPSYNEHVDSHQSEVANLLSSRGLATVRSVSELTLVDLQQARVKGTILSSKSMSLESAPGRLNLSGTNPLAS